jgi:predicted AAA+ superfamily ATPase
LRKLFELRAKLAGWLAFAADWLAPNPAADDDKSRFVDLAPTDKADEAGVYSAALAEATSNPRVMNIALTGPYGSGKSSIIKSFLKRYKRLVCAL